MLCGDKALPFERSDNEITCLSRQIGDVTNGAGARSCGGAKGLAHQVREVSFAGLASGLGDLDEHWLRKYCNMPGKSIIKYEICIILLATFPPKKPAFLGLFAKRGRKLG